MLALETALERAVVVTLQTLHEMKCIWVLGWFFKDTNYLT